MMEQGDVPNNFDFKSSPGHICSCNLSPKPAYTCTGYKHMKKGR